MKKETEKRLLLFLWIACTFTLCIAFILTMLGFIDLKIINDTKVPYWLDFLGNMSMFMVNMFFVFSISLMIFDYKTMFILLIKYVPIYLLCCFFPGMGLAATAVAPFIYILFTAKKLKIKLKSVVKRYIQLSFIIVLYSQISGYIKLNILNLNLQYFEFNNFISLFIFSIDLYIIYFLCYKEVNFYVGKMVDWKCTEAIKFCKEIFLAAPKNEQDLKEINDIKQLTKKQKFIFYLILYLFNICTLLIIVLIGTLNLGFFETGIMIAVFMMSRKVLGKSYHANKLENCGFITIIAFYSLSKISLPLNISLFAGIFLVSGFTLALHKYRLITDELKQLARPKDFNIKNASKDELMRACKACGITEHSTDILILKYICGKKDCEIAALKQMEIQSVTTNLYRSRKVLRAYFE